VSRPVPLTDLTAFLVGQADHPTAATGCTVIVAPEGAVAGVDVRGGSPGTRDTDALNPVMNRKAVHAVLLTGGSAFGLDAAGGVMADLEARGVGRDVAVTTVPNVCAAVLFDLTSADPRDRPDAALGRAATEAAWARVPFQPGRHGAGRGAWVGKGRGLEHASPGGQGAAAFAEGDLIVGAVMAVNAVGDVVKGDAIIAGARRDDGGFTSSEDLILARYATPQDFFAEPVSDHTVIGCVLTNARLDKAQAAKVAQCGQNGIARAIRPAHTVYDGDTVFALASGETAATLDAVCILAARAVEAAIVAAVTR
jgi:L-aminopeptidase/D-esterase-like protein